MKEKESSEVIKGQRPGDVVVVKRSRPPRRKLRSVPNVPGFIRFFGDLASQTPLIPIILALVILLLVFSTALYAVERGGEESIESFGEAVYWCISSMQTMGSADPLLVTTAGTILGSIWAMISTILFFGAIIAGMTSYFMLHRRRPSREIVSTIQYNLERLEDLSVEELHTLRGTVDSLIETRINNIKTGS